MNQQVIFKSALLSLAVLVSTSQVCTMANTGSKASNTKTAASKNFKYTRIDFEVHGSKCPSCIRRLVKKLRKSKGVEKADISIMKPFAGVIIFDHSLTNFEKLKKRMKSENVKPIKIEMEETNRIPPILIPKSLKRKLKMRKKNK